MDRSRKLTRVLFPYDWTKQLEAVDSSIWLCIRVSIYIFFVLELVQLPNCRDALQIGALRFIFGLIRRIS